MKRVLFLCSGNYYRSRFAEIVFNAHASERGLGWRAESRGLALDSRNAGPISRYTTSALAARGISWADYLRAPLPVTDADFAAAQRVIAVKETEHRLIVESRHAAWRPRVEYWTIHDVDCAPPEQALPQLESRVLSLLEQLSTAAAA
jgi:protein-tyrosine phosphatase